MSFLDDLKKRLLVPPPAATPARPAEHVAPGFGGSGGFGASPAPAPRAPAKGGSGGIGGFGARVAPVTTLPAALPFDPWPDGVDWHLTAAACRLAALVEAGCDWRWCPVGGLGVVQADGRAWMIAPAYAARMRDAGLLPDAVREAAP